MDEIKRLEFQIAKCDANLSNESYLKKAPESVILKEKQKRKDFASELEALKRELNNSSNLDDNCIGSFQVKSTTFYVYYTPKEKRVQMMKEELIKYFGDIDIFEWQIQELREKKSIFEEYSKEWFDYIYNTDIEQDEIIELFEKIKNEKNR